MGGMKPYVIGILIILVGIAAYLGFAKFADRWPFQAATPSPVASGLTQYHSDRFGFDIFYSSPFRPYRDSEDLNYIPLCGDNPADVCLVYPKAEYPQTNFDGGAVAVTIEACDMPANGQKIGTANINGTSFEVYTFGDAATSHQVGGTLWRTAYGTDQCLDIGARIYTTTFEVWPAGSITRFTDADRQHVASAMETVVKTFRLATGQSGVAGHVLVGPTCPVVRVDDPSCADRPYQGQFIVRSTVAGQQVATFTTDANGNFRVLLAPGDYTIEPAQRIGITDQPYAVTVRSGRITWATITFDTGIR